MKEYHAPLDVVEEVARRLAAEGFTVTGKSRLGVAVAGPTELAGRMFANFLLSGPRRPPEAVLRPILPRDLDELVDHVRAAPRIRYFGPASTRSPQPHGRPAVSGPAASGPGAPGPAASGPGASTRAATAPAGRRGPRPDPPILPYYHLEVPDDVARLMDARAAHDHGFTGAGVRVCIIDTGFRPHPWFAKHGFSVATVGDNHPEDDEVGHGTGIITNAMAVAPGACFIGVKLDRDAAAAFQRARTAEPHVISCSWGTYGFDRDLHDEIVDAVAHGIVVCFAAGNGPGGASWPGSMPEVVSVGGVYVDERGRLEASSYASSGTNADEPGRFCPDVSGLTGRMPMGIYIAMPTQEGSELDAEFSAGGASFPDGDGTGAADGWLVASGTSSATPAVAGVAALILEAEPGLGPEEVKARLREAGRDVTVGVSANGDRAAPGPDAATGAGLVSALLAVHPVDVWCKDSPDDNGTVPDTYPAAWTSPDIWVRRRDDGGLDAGLGPEPGRTNWVYVRVRNRGRREARDVKVRLFWAEPSLAVRWPSDWRTTGIKVDGRDGNERTIGVVPPGGEAVTGAFEWVPDDATVHPLLLARVECPDDPVTREGDVAGDNNLAARNVMTAEAAPGGRATFVVGVGRVRGLRGKPALVVDRRGTPAEAVVGLGPADETDSAPPKAQAPAPERSPAPTREPPPTPGPVVRRVRNVEHGIQVEPLNFSGTGRRRVAVTVDVPPGAEPGARYTVRLDQRVGPVTTGHATLVVSVAERAEPRAGARPG